MKHTYIAPRILSVRLAPPLPLCVSQGEDEYDGVADARRFYGDFAWDEPAEDHFAEDHFAEPEY